MTSVVAASCSRVALNIGRLHCRMLGNFLALDTSTTNSASLKPRAGDPPLRSLCRALSRIDFHFVPASPSMNKKERTSSRWCIDTTYATWLDAQLKKPLTSRPSSPRLIVCLKIKPNQRCGWWKASRQRRSSVPHLG